MRSQRFLDMRTIVSNTVILSDFLRKAKSKWFPIALIISVFFGYNFGKDRAERDNMRDSLGGGIHDSRTQQ